MARYSLNDLARLINQQIQNREALDEYLHKANTLIEVALGAGFLKLPTPVLYHHLWVVNDVLETAKIINEGALAVLFRIKLV